MGKNAGDAVHVGCVGVFKCALVTRIKHLIYRLECGTRI
jgi:hypothetical protein